MVRFLELGPVAVKLPRGMLQRDLAPLKRRSFRLAALVPEHRGVFMPDGGFRVPSRGCSVSSRGRRRYLDRQRSKRTTPEIPDLIEAVRPGRTGLSHSNRATRLAVG